MNKKNKRAFDVPAVLDDRSFDFAQRRPFLTSKSISYSMLESVVRSMLDGTPVGVYGTGTYGRCKYGSGVRGIYGDGKYGLASYTT